MFQSYTEANKSNKGHLQFINEAGEEAELLWNVYNKLGLQTFIMFLLDVKDTEYDGANSYLDTPIDKTVLKSFLKMIDINIGEGILDAKSVKKSKNLYIGVTTDGETFAIFDYTGILK